MWPKLYAVETKKEEKKKEELVPQIIVYFIVAQKPTYCGHTAPLIHIGILDFNGQFHTREMQTSFCCRGHLLPTVKTNMYLYTDIDIFKTRRQLFLFFFFFSSLVFVTEMYREWKETYKTDSGKLWRSLLGGHKRLRAHQNWAKGAERQARNSFKKPPPYLITDNSVMGTDSGTNGHVWHRGKSLDETELKWLQLPLLFFSVCPFFLQLCLLLLCFDGHTSPPPPKLQDRTDRDACFISSTSRCSPFSFPSSLVSGGQAKSSPVKWRLAPPPSLCWLHDLHGGVHRTERGWVLGAVVLKEAVTLRKTKKDKKKQKKKRINQNYQPN